MTRTCVLRVVVASLGASLIGCHVPLAQPERPTQPESLAPNAGFEQGAGDRPEAWSFHSWESAEGWWDGEVFRSGSKSIGLQGINGGWNANISVERGMVYSLCFHYRAEGGPSRATLFVREVIDGRATESIVYKPLPTIPADQGDAFVDGAFVDGADEQGWVLFDGGDFIPREGVETVNILIKLVSRNPEARLWLDDIVLTARKPLEAPVTARRLAELAAGVVWTDSENRKILPDQQPPAGDPDPSIPIAAAGGEYECFQIAITPTKDMPQVKWTWGPFTGPAQIPAEAMTCRLIECIPIERPRGPYGQQGLHPDALTNRFPIDLPAGMTQGFWFAVKAPAGQTAGVYRTELSLRAGGREVARFPLSLTVRGFSIPRRPSLGVTSSFRYHLVLPREAGEPTEVIERYYRSFFEHRTRCTPAAAPVVRVRGDGVELDLDEYVSHLRLLRDEHGMQRFSMASLWIGHRGTHRMPPDASWQGQRIFADEELTKLSPEFERPFRSYLRQLCDRLKEEGLFLSPVVRFFDEPQLDDAATRNGLKALAKLILDVEPEITVAIAASDPHPELTDVMRLWVIHTDAWDRVAKRIEAAREAGCAIHVYNNAVNSPEHRRLRVRLWPWLLWQYGVDGTYSWWGTVCWRGELEDPWTCGGGEFSGVMLYPPRSPQEQGPIESVRWELFREGLEDYEYLALADKLAADLEAAGKANEAKPGRAALEEAMRLVDRWPNVKAANDEPYTVDPTKVDAARDALADAIQTMQQALGG